jgi:5-methylcytosine-specific restriction endonuclease McrA
MRLQQLKAHPLCKYCLDRGDIVPATVADHVIPHRLDPQLFWYGELQSLCKMHHDGSKQTEEHFGHSIEIGIDGYPVRDIPTPVRSQQIKK